MAEAGLVERFREGSWAFFRLGERGGSASLARDLVARLDPHDTTIARDRERLASVRAARAAAAQKYFARHAAEWDRIRKLHVADDAVEEAIRKALADKPFRSLLDLGTGTGRMLELFGPSIERGLGLDMSLDMLSLARNAARPRRAAPLQRAAGRHLRSGAAEGILRRRHHPSGAALPRRRRARHRGSGTRAAPVGRLLVVDFAPHDLEFLRDEHAHRRLGFPAEAVSGWLAAAGLDVVKQQTLAPDKNSDGKIAVSLWLGRDPRMLVADAPEREVA